jgi:sulfofructosephosphate aldolase
VTTTGQAPAAPPSLDAIARPSGAFAMVAMDQRESLRAMFDAAGRGRPDDDVLVDFKLAVARTIGPLASGFLIDRHYGFERVRAEGLLPPGCGLILAADALEQEPGGPVEETALDTVVTEDLALDGVAALKLLVIWRRDERRQERIRLAREFVAAAARRGVLSVLEPVVRATQRELDEGSWDTDAAIREAAEELSPLGASLYKVQVPQQGKGTEQELEDACRLLGQSIVGPWVVLSQGVDLADFPAAVAAACRGGASGFLAGRALWSDVVGSDRLEERLREVSVPRLEALGATVDRLARPWKEAR